jgi:oligosaccharide reducing-end xylanase
VLLGRSSCLGRAGSFLLAVSLLSACTSTVDSLGHDAAAVTPESPKPPTLLPITGPDTYENAFQDLLGNDPGVIGGKVNAAYQQLFHGDPDTEAIYFTLYDDPTPQSGDYPIVSDDEAKIFDLYHKDTRIEGIALGMLISVELEHQEEFDKLWNYAKRELAYTGSKAGYYRSFCDAGTDGSTPCADPYGLQVFATSLIFAHDHWKTSLIGNIDYAADALAILDVMLHKEQQNGGIVDGVTNVFDAETQLVFDVPDASAAGQTRPSILMPAFYDLWAQATGNPFWSSAADAARNFWPKSANDKTGLMPLRAYFDGTAVSGADTFQNEGYRVFPNLVLDQIWGAGTVWSGVELNRVLQFFSDQGINSYGSAYKLDGTEVQGKNDHEIALVIVNGMSASPATLDQRKAFIQAVWNLTTPTKDYRYYQGILYLFAMCVLSGNMKVL